jgi:outer membrane protein OmpA-like peptidoglycan-associated protein
MRIQLLFVCLFISSVLLSQDEEKQFCNEIDSKDALKLYAKGTDKKKYPKPERLAFLKKCLEEVPDFAEANMAMGQEIIVHCKLEGKPFTPACYYFQKAIASCPKIHSEAYYYIGFDYYEQEKNDSATKYLNLFINFKDDNEKKYGKDYEAELYQSKEMIKSMKKESSLRKNVDFHPRVVQGISSRQDEYLAYVSPDDRNCFFVRKLPLNQMDKVYQSDQEKETFMRAVRDPKTNEFSNGEPMPWPFNETNDNQGGCAISLDNKHMYFAMMRAEGGPNMNCDLYVSDNVDDEWKPFTKLGTAVNDPKYWDSQPTVGANDNYIIFASDRPGGYGGIDLYITRRDSITKEWGKPQNLGPKINTKGNEKTPFIHTDSRTLYFSSNGHYGFGGYDIFFSRKDDKGEWQDPENIGSPINSGEDETGFFVSANAHTGYFCAYDEGKTKGLGVGRYDLFSFPLYEGARPNEMKLIETAVKDFDGDKAREVDVEFRDAHSNEKLASIADKRTGQAVVAIDAKKTQSVLMVVKKEERAYNSTIVQVKDLIAAPTVVDADGKIKPVIEMKMEEIAVGKNFVINNIYFNTSSTHLFEESKTVLKSFAQYLKENPKLKIEIQGHTDNVGKPADNQALSENRAFTVKETLESYGVEAGRITEKGFGSSKPIADNGSEAGRAKNRRTEFKILEN